MKLYTHHRRIKLKQRIGTLSTLGGGLLMVVALFLVRHETYGFLAWPLTLGGLGVAMLGTYHVNRWVRPPLPHRVLADALGRLDGRHLLLNHIGPIPHLLLTPKGLVAIHAKRYDGPAHYDAATGRWRGKFSIVRMYWQGLTAEGLGDPGEEVTQARMAVLRWLQVRLPDLAEQIPVEGVALFLAPSVSLTVPEPPPVPLAQPDSIKKVVQGLMGSEPSLPHATYARLRDALLAEAAPVASEEESPTEKPRPKERPRTKEPKARRSTLKPKK